MATMTLRVNDQDAELVRRYANFEGKSISDFIRDAIFEKIEDAHDLRVLREAIAEDDGTRYTLDEVEEMLGL
ncbi:DUF1778 domain-containing protein [Leucobacter sp. OH2974_COT-288]|uniref:Uncharacterized protein (DUF1778 family) n=1 Tax=Canibacter oris TaxID=1365628 RepID=A0A840DQF7_9MICO|nr:DUF6290 family protein [Canibacter oris]MBB4071426.1 uncharacterized protein (DUF1778 family) [Canibacter oris]RRD35695.1 DUF1778 domain-containing protein [Leucobacter sp. OH2974_COT-288]